MAAQPEEYLAVLKASYNYDPQSDDEITIKEDQILLLKERVDDEFVSSLLSSFSGH
jgi:actin cytoskeleton-regulatory complex protein SLA1